MENEIASQEDSGPAPVRAARRRRAASQTLPKVGMQNTVRSATGVPSMQQLQSGFLARKQILVVPPEILAANPDKHFVFLNMNKLEKNGMWHPNGYRCFKVNEKESNPQLARFSTSIDGFVHRNEMVLAYITKEEKALQDLEKEAMMSQSIGDRTISGNPELNGFDAWANETRETVNFKPTAQ